MSGWMKLKKALSQRESSATGFKNQILCRRSDQHCLTTQCSLIRLRRTAELGRYALDVYEARINVATFPLTTISIMIPFMYG